MTVFVDEKFTEAQINQIKATRPGWVETVDVSPDGMFAELEGPVTSVVVKDVTSYKLKDEVIVRVQATQSVYPDGEHEVMQVSVTRTDKMPPQDFTLEDALKVADAIKETVAHVKANGGMANPKFEHMTDALTTVVKSLMESMRLDTVDVAERIGMPTRSFERVLAGAKPWGVATLYAVATVVGVTPGNLLLFAQENTIKPRPPLRSPSENSPVGSPACGAEYWVPHEGATPVCTLQAGHDHEHEADMGNNHYILWGDTVEEVEA